jgi:hypothetical protein
VYVCLGVNCGWLRLVPSNAEKRHMDKDNWGGSLAGLVGPDKGNGESGANGSCE